MAFDPNQPFTIVQEEVAFDPTKPFSIVSSEAPAIEEESGFLRQVADIPLKVAQGGISSVKSFTDLFGADNAMSKELAGYEKWVGSLVSAESKKDDEEIARILKDAENKGVYDKVVAGLEAFSKAPLEMTAQSVGYMIPQLAAGVLGKAAQFTKAGIIGTQAAIGFAQGAGQAKGDIYESTLDYLRKQGVPENVANDKAIEAQATLGKNLDQILLSGGLNALASTTGAEAIATRILTKQGKEATGGAIKGLLKGVAAESPLEAIQSAQQEVAKNIGVQGVGGDVPTFKGAIESATTGAVAGAFIGGPLGAFEAMSPEQKEEIDITKEANRKARDLEAPDTATQAIAAAITNLERGIDNKRKDLDVLETTSPEAAKLRLDIAADQKILAQSKEQANKLGLSEPITEAERQQAELAKAIVEEPTPTVKESLTVQPTPAAPVAEAVMPAPAPVEQVVTPPVEVAPTIGEAAPITPAPVTEQAAPAEAPAPEVAPVESKEGQFSIYQMERKDGMRWLVQSGEKRGFGDVIFNTKEEAEKYASTEKQRQQERATVIEREAQIKLDEEAAKQVREKNVNEFTTAIGAAPLSAGKIKKTLMEKTAKRTGGKVYEGTRAQVVEQFTAIGFKPTTAQVDVVKDLTRSQFNRMDNRQQAEFQKRKKAAGKKTEYRLENAEGYLFPVTKAEYDYAKWLESRPEIQLTSPAQPAKILSERAVKMRIEDNDSIPITAVETYGITLPEGYAKQGDLYVYQPTPAVSETITKPKLGEKGGVLIPTKEDFIQAGQNIYEAGMEFGAWAKQMIQQFGDAVREFLGDVWQAVSGAPAKLNELMGYLPGKGEAGSVNLGSGKPATESKNALELIRGNYGELSDMINKIIDSNQKIADALQKIPVELTSRNSFDGETVRISKSFSGLKLVDAINHEITHSFLAVALREIPSFREAINSIRLDAIERAKYSNDISFRGAVSLIKKAQGLSRGLIYPKKETENLSQYMIRNTNGLMYLWNLDKTNPPFTYEIFESAYALASNDEFLAHLMSDKRFRDELKTYKVFTPDNRNLFQKFIDSIKGLFQKLTKVEKTVLDKAMEQVERVVQLPEYNPRPIEGLAEMLAKYEQGDAPIEPEAGIPSAERKEIMGKKIGELKDTPKNIISKTKELLRKRVFDPTQVTEQNTTEAFRALGKLTGNKQERRDFADELNDIATIVEDTGAAAEVSMGAALFVNDLFEYAVRLAAQGNKKMLGIMMTNINRLPTGTEGRSDAGRALRAAREMKDTFLTMAKAEQDAFVNYAAEFVYGPNPTQEQIDSIKIGYDAVEKVEEPTAKELEEEIAAVGEKTGTDLVGKINEEFTKATEKGKEKRKTEIEELDSEYKKIQEEADKEIEKLAKIQSDTPSFDPIAARQTANDVRAIVANDLKQRPEMGRKAPWKSMLVAKLQEAGVEVAAAETLADIVWRQHEINNLSRELSSINKAVEKGPISEIVKAIKDTPLEEQQNPNWRYEVMRNYLRMAGLSVAQAERIARLMDISLQKRFTQAKEQAFTDAISKTAPWKSGNIRSKRSFQQVLQAIRAGALDPSRNMVSDIAALNGWTGFTAEQYKVLLKNDTILANKESKDIQKAEAYKAIQDIISKSKLPIRARDVIGQYYDAQALSGIPTLSVNSFSPIAFAMRNAIVEAGSGTIKGDARAIGRAVTTFVDSIKSWANTVAFSFKNNTTVYSNVDYIVNDDNLLRLYRRGVDQFTKGKTPRDRADGVKNMMIGMMDYVRRALNALDYGAIASLQNQNISKYAMAVMKRQKMTDKQANEMFGVMMKAKNDFYLQQIAIGTDKNKASILSDEFYISSWKEALSKAGVEKSEIQQAMDAAINDALSSVGRNRQSLDAFKEESTKLKDSGVASAPALWLLESMANAANQSDSQAKKLFARIIYGYSIVPARVIRETAWFSPYGFVRFGWDAIAKAMGKTSPYAQSLGTDVQYSQRLNEATAGTVALLGLMALRAGSTDDPEDKEEFKIVFTGNGPQRKDDAQFYDSWYKAGNKPNSTIISFGKTKFALNMMRGFEAFTWPAMMLGALDDLEIRKKQKQKPNSSTEMEDAAIVAGFVFDAALRRGPYAFTTKSLFGTYGDIGVEGVAKGLTFPAKTLIPVLGTSLASNLSNFMNDPIDRRTLDGAVWSNIPFIGPAVAPKSLNAFGEPALSTDMASKMFKLGVPIVFDIPTDRESIKLHELVLKQGGGPSIPTRNQLAQRLDRQPTNKEYEMFVREYGASLTKSMKSSYNYLFNAKPELYSKRVEKIGLRARDAAESKVKRAARNP